MGQIYTYTGWLESEKKCRNFQLVLHNYSNDWFYIYYEIQNAMFKAT